MSSEKIKELSVRLFEEVWNQGNLDVIDEIISENYVVHIGNIDVKGITNYKNYISSYRIAFPDIYFNIDDIIVHDDKVVERYSATGTHNGNLLGIPPTYKKAKISGIDIVRIKNGKMVERWGQADLLGLIKQLGIIPELNNLKI